MKRVTTVNLSGNAYQLDEDAYQVLEAYFAQAETRLANDPDRSEILGDLERSVADKCLRYLGEHKNVITRAEAQQIVEELGPVEARAGEWNGQQAAPDAQRESDAGAARGQPPRRLVQIREGAMISGVCNGLAAYFNIDVTIMRVIFIVLAILSSGIWALVYVMLMFLIPYDTDIERMNERGLHAQVFRFVTQTKRKFAAS
ncbi:MAG: hypothetical protein DIU71_00410 [Proteobacteria bacterium]|nr:MAG: hypothetical protein DIU71_00410 [Pseudomonadota bacterium]